MRTMTVSIATMLMLAGCSEYDISAKEQPIEPAYGKIQVTPPIIDFGTVPVGDVAQGFFQIENIGAATLDLGDLTINSDYDGFVLTTTAHGMQLEPGDTADGMVEYTGAIGTQTGKVVVPSDDPETPKARVELIAGADADKPIAVCSTDPSEIEAISESATLIGDQSYDPNDLAITEAYWTGVLRPNGSQAAVPTVPTTQINIPGFVPDLVGTYGFELVVVNEAGVPSDPCYTELEAIPAQDLWVEMFWDHSGDDMDLHLTRAGGDLRTNADCYYANCVFNGPDWGPGGASGDPSLDLDDIPGTGPENINVDTPEDVTYGVFVHDYPGSSYQSANAVTVNVYLSGVLAWSDTRDISGENSDTHFADVDWANQTVIPR